MQCSLGRAPPLVHSPSFRMRHATILGIDPGTRYMGVAVVRGPELLLHGVRQLSNGTHPHDVIGQARSIVLGYVAHYAPHVVAVERPLPIATRRAAVLSVITQELVARATELRLTVLQLGPEDVRRLVVGAPFARKVDVARVLVERHGFGVLRRRIPQRPARAALGPRPRDRYWLHAFDALAVAVAARLEQSRPEGPPSSTGPST
jgi:Holliday junction resolvasome RuvABC endonuclease subunit